MTDTSSPTPGRTRVIARVVEPHAKAAHPGSSPGFWAQLALAWSRGEYAAFRRESSAATEARPPARRPVLVRVERHEPKARPRSAHADSDARHSTQMTDTSLQAKESMPVTTSLADRVEVIDALYRFGAGQDLRDRALFESAFGEHASLDFTGPARRLGVTIPVFVGRTAIVDTILGTVSSLDTTHTVTNPRVSLDGDRATLFALVEAQHLPRGNHRRNLLLKNIYWVDLSRDGARWVIDRMAIDNVWFEGDPAVLFPAAASDRADSAE